ncbi:class I SAM-dependent methyltransferase [Brevibacterium paucivorans]|uniref:Class I SAM-dependent methyltransferase n=1 Tax=Brevibacterium paucivorans TaxID=170994 RepID=A0A2N6VLR8_9MICO|nr:class I SAM-dependent methyltransferase [Brevibacterium paucivorans]PMD04963.1 hypothetical protein CJ199_07645 [Brevibacterium paucivorans]
MNVESPHMLSDGELRRKLWSIEKQSILNRSIIPNEVNSLIFLNRILSPSRLMPQAGGWAASYTLIATVVDYLLSKNQPLIYDFGGGVSTLWLSLYCAKFDGKIVSIDESDHYTSLTRSHLDRLGTADTVNLIHAPVTSQEDYKWYTTETIPLGADIDAVIVDGPTGSSDTCVRYKALPFLANNLADGALVILDDTHRSDEALIADQWQEEFSLSKYCEQPRNATAFTFHR